MSGVKRLAAEKSLWAAALYSLVLLTIYHETAWSMVAIWSRSDTFAHGFLILPISIWLIWTYRHRLHGLAPQPSLLPLWLMLPAATAWLLAYLVGVAVIQQLALVSLLVLGIWAILGHQLTWVMSFPLFFLFFAVPMGEGLIAPMMEFTADSTVWLIQISGIPVYREGLNFTLPSGAWSVVEACSGVRYIIASVTVGVLYAYLTYVSLPRRLIFIAISAVMPIFANTLRAYIIVMLGHFSDMKIATGADHLIYGWVFFGLVIFLLFWLGSFFRQDDGLQDAALSKEKPEGAAASFNSLTVSVLVTLVVAGIPALIAATRLAPVPTFPLALELPAPAVTWKHLTSPYWHWRPVSTVGGFSSAYYYADDQPVGVFVQYSDGTLMDSEVIGSGRLFVKWRSGTLVVGSTQMEVDLPSGTAKLDEVYLDGVDGEMLVWSWYLVDGESTVNNYQAKLGEVIARLSGGDSRTYRLLLATPMREGLEGSRSRLQDYLDLHGDQLYKSLSEARGVAQ